MGDPGGTAEIGKLRWRCRRGMKELDVLLTRYVDEDYAKAGADQRGAFERLLELPDPVIHDYVLGRGVPDEPALREIVARMTAARANEPN